MKLLKPPLFPQGFHLQKFDLNPELQHWVRQGNWDQVDQYFKEVTQPGGDLFQALRQFHEFTVIETMISIRDASNEWEEDGIWHDDGSRVFAFSLSLTLDAHRVDGVLELRRKGEAQVQQIHTPEFGTAILFLTGVHGYEHRTRAVTKGKRVMLVGWCSD